MKIGVLGGTFDPIHNGHLAIAEEARAYLNLNEVIFLPAGQPWMKSDRSISPARHRTAMIGLALQARPYFKSSTIEIEHQGPSYSVNSMENTAMARTGKTDRDVFSGGGATAGLRTPEYEKIRSSAARYLEEGYPDGQTAVGNQRHGYQKQGCSGYTDRRPGPSSGGKIYPGKRVIPETVGLKTRKAVSLYVVPAKAGIQLTRFGQNRRSVTANR